MGTFRAWLAQVDQVGITNEAVAPQYWGDSMSDLGDVELDSPSRDPSAVVAGTGSFCSTGSMELDGRRTITEVVGAPMVSEGGLMTTTPERGVVEEAPPPSAGLFRSVRSPGERMDNMRRVGSGVGRGGGVEGMLVRASRAGSLDTRGDAGVAPARGRSGSFTNSETLSPARSAHGSAEEIARRADVLVDQDAGRGLPASSGDQQPLRTVPEQEPTTSSSSIDVSLENDVGAAPPLVEEEEPDPASTIPPSKKNGEGGIFPPLPTANSGILRAVVGEGVVSRFQTAEEETPLRSENDRSPTGTTGPTRARRKKLSWRLDFEDMTNSMPVGHFGSPSGRNRTAGADFLPPPIPARGERIEPPEDGASSMAGPQRGPPDALPSPPTHTAQSHSSTPSEADEAEATASAPLGGRGRYYGRGMGEGRGPPRTLANLKGRLSVSQSQQNIRELVRAAIRKERDGTAGSSCAPEKDGNDAKEPKSRPHFLQKSFSSEDNGNVGHGTMFPAGSPPPIPQPAATSSKVFPPSRSTQQARPPKRRPSGLQGRPSLAHTMSVENLLAISSSLAHLSSARGVVRDLSTNPEEDFSASPEADTGGEINGSPYHNIFDDEEERGETMFPLKLELIDLRRAEFRSWFWEDFNERSGDYESADIRDISRHDLEEWLASYW